MIHDPFVIESSPARRIEVKHGKPEVWKLPSIHWAEKNKEKVDHRFFLSTLTLFALWVCVAKLQLKPQRDVHGKFALRSMKRSCKIVQLLWGVLSHANTSISERISLPINLGSSISTCWVRTWDFFYQDSLRGRTIWTIFDLMRNENCQGGVERFGALQMERKKRKDLGSKLKPPSIYKPFCFSVETVKAVLLGWFSEF